MYVCVSIGHLKCAGTYAPIFILFIAQLNYCSLHNAQDDNAQVCSLRREEEKNAVISNHDFDTVFIVPVMIYRHGENIKSHHTVFIEKQALLPFFPVVSFTCRMNERVFVAFSAHNLENKFWAAH